MKKLLVVLTGIVFMVSAMPVLAQETKTGQGALVGGLLGAAAGGVIGHQKGKTGQGALIGGAVGALGGAMVGSQMKSEPAVKTKKAATTPAYDATTHATKAAEPAKVTMKQIIYWTEQGLPSDEIIARITKAKSAFTLTEDDVAYLQQKGVSQLVIETMQGK